VRGQDLTDAHNWALRHPRGAPAVTAAQQTILGASRAAEIDRRRRRRLLRLVLAMVVDVGMGYVGWSNRSYLAASLSLLTDAMRPAFLQSHRSKR
jgi:hypothetical protein